MGDIRISAMTAATSLANADQFAVAQSGATKSATASVLRQYVGAGLTGASVAAVAGGYAADTYLAGSAITIPVAGAWKAGTIYCCVFDMTKTAAGVAAFTVTVRMGTLGTVSDSSVLSLAFAAGTAAVDTGLFELLINFRTVGSGVSAVVAGLIQCTHHLAATGLVSTGASGTGIITAASGGFASTTQTIIGCSVNGGASFSGTNTMVQAYALNI